MLRSGLGGAHGVGQDVRRFDHAARRRRRVVDRAGGALPTRRVQFYYRAASRFLCWRRGLLLALARSLPAAFCVRVMRMSTGRRARAWPAVARARTRGHFRARRPPTARPPPARAHGHPRAGSRGVQRPLRPRAACRGIGGRACALARHADLLDRTARFLVAGGRPDVLLPVASRGTGRPTCSLPAAVSM